MASDLNQCQFIGRLGKDPEVLMSRLIAKVKVDAASGCWNWAGSLSRGYGQLSSRRGHAPYKAHRLSYELFVGAIGDGLVVRHDCDNPRCCNPMHLRLGTQKDNARDASTRHRLNPVSKLNLRPGARGYHGAGPISNMEKLNGISK